MPSSRRSQANSSETRLDPRRESLRRLSSLTSLHLLNPFNRRRSNNTQDSPSTASHASLSSSTIAEAPEHQRDHSTAQLFGEYSKNAIGPVPPPPIPSGQWPERKSSYICLPDDPIGGMPRSRTFSNLPLPTRAKMSHNPLAQSKSHARLPSLTHPASHTRLPSTQSKSHARLPSVNSVMRLPSPIISNRKYSGSRLPVMENRQFEKKGLPRSDTIPLLGGHSRDTSFRRPTAFKENISLSPVRPLSALEMLDEESTHDSSLFAPASFDSNQDWFESEGSHLSRNQSFDQLSSVGSSSAEKARSSPLYRSSRHRPGTPGQCQGLQWGQSQPMLTSYTNNRQSYGPIRQTRLMSARQAPTPPHPKTPAAKQILNSNSNLQLVSHASDHIRQVSEQLSPDRLYQTGPVRSRGDFVGQRTSPKSHSATKQENLITRAEPVGYWTGRFSTLNDRYRNEELHASLPITMDAVRETPRRHYPRSSASSNAWPSKRSTDKMHTADANTARMRRAVVELYGLCGNEAARDSFSNWQAQLSTALHNPALRRPVKVSGKVSGCQLEMGLREDDSTPRGSLSVGSSSRKKSFMEKILGRRKVSGFETCAVGVGA